MFHASDFSGCGSPGNFSGLVGKHREQASVARVKVQMILIGLPKIGLLENERHSQETLPEIHCDLLGRTNNGDVMNPLNLYSLHTRLLEIGIFNRAQVEYATFPGREQPTSEGRVRPSMGGTAAGPHVEASHPPVRLTATRRQ